jgi:hypothetical protein
MRDVDESPGVEAEAEAEAAEDSLSEAELGLLEDPAELWEAEMAAGFATARYDPATGRRRHCGLNGRQVTARRRRRPGDSAK